ncbi:MAG: HD domain-containing protein [Deltaproteobacteria bacterium]|nr:HD domain-containing protein [Deltaproteobacteria bacterium]
MKCPGQDRRYWKTDAIFEAKCPKCGNAVEFFKDDTTRKCSNCGHRFLNPAMDFGCAAYCKYAEQCIGDLPPELITQRENLLKDRVAIEMKRYFNHDFKRIGHASRVARHAEKICRQEGGNPAIVLAAAYLHDIGIREAEKKYQSSAARYQEQEGPQVARKILESLGARDEIIEEVCDIIGHHHHPRDKETINFMCLYDADMIANLEEKKKKGIGDVEELKKTIEASFLSSSGRVLAKEVLL